MVNRVQLLAELRSLSHDARVTRMIALGRAARSDKKAQALLNELWSGEVYERRLVLKSCFASRDGARVLDAVVDPSRLVRGAARKLVALCCDDAQTVSALQKTYAVRQHLPILLALHHRGRRLPIDQFLTWLAGRPEDCQACRPDSAGFGAAARRASSRRPAPPEYAVLGAHADVCPGAPRRAPGGGAPARTGGLAVAVGAGSIAGAACGAGSRCDLRDRRPDARPWHGRGGAGDGAADHAPSRARR